MLLFQFIGFALFLGFLLIKFIQVQSIRPSLWTCSRYNGLVWLWTI